MTSRSGRSSGQLQVIFDGLQGGGLAIDPDMADPGRRHEVEHAIENAVAGAQDRNEAQFLAGQHRHWGAFERRLDVGLLERQVAGRLVTEQQADLAHQLAEFRGAGVGCAHQRQLVPHQRVIDDRHDFGRRGRSGNLRHLSGCLSLDTAPVWIYQKLPSLTEDFGLDLSDAIYML